MFWKMIAQNVDNELKSFDTTARESAGLEVSERISQFGKHV